MLFNNMGLVILFVLGIIASFIGFGFRDRNPGIVLMGIGFLATLYVIIQKAIETFG